MPKKYSIEREGQIDFFDNYGVDYVNNPVLIDNTDGVYNGCLFEFKLNIGSLNSVLYQAIKYLSKMRIKGESVPATILLVDLNKTLIYEYKSKDYFDDIHKVYIGGASVNNKGFVQKGFTNKYNYSKTLDSSKVRKIIIGNKTDKQKYMAINIDENCIVGWGERYYRELPKASKGDFLGDEKGTKVQIVGEIRDPKQFKNLILPYKGETNEKFKYLMDCLNDRLKKKDLGAFYTPVAYCEKAVELVRKAIKNVPVGNDYVIIDRCAGTGNLEAVLNDDELSHVIVSTYEYYEYKVLQERIGDKVREIIPPSEANVVYLNGTVSNADALSEEYINNPVIKQYLDNRKCSIILFENPPYRDDTSGMTGIKSADKKKKSYVLDKMKDAGISKTNEMANRFIWSGFKYYLRQPTDSYIIFTPIKYWKADQLVDYKFGGGFVFNKKHFHAPSPSATTCIWWQNKKANNKNLNFTIYDIDNKGKLQKIGKESTSKVYNEITKLFDKHSFTSDDLTNYYCNVTNGDLVIRNENKSYFNNDILGYFVGRGFAISNPNLNLNLLRLTSTDYHGFYITKDNYLKKLPLLCMKHHVMFKRKWWEVEFVFCSADGGKSYEKDKDFLKKCFIFSMLDYYNKTKSLCLPNGKIVKNELCFDKGTIATKHLTTLKLNKDETKIIDLWKRILKESKKTDNYNSKYAYGIYQISTELNTFTEIDINGKKIKKPDYPELNGDLESLKAMLSKYYDNYISDKMFKYELIK